MDPEQFAAPVVGGCNPQGGFEMANGLLSRTLGMVDITEKTVGVVELIFFTCLWEGIDYAV